MKLTKKILCITIIGMVMTSVGLCQFSSFRPRGMRGTVGVGLAEYNVIQGGQNFQMDGGLFTSVQGETELSGPLLITLQLNYLQSKGRTNYNYSTLSQNFTGSDLGFSSNTFQIGLGLKYRPFSQAVMSPYIEGGGLVGYYQLQFLNAAAKISPSGDYKSKDSLIETGYFGDAGLEVMFSEKFAIQIGYRYQMMTTRPFSTLGNSTLVYSARIIHFGVSTQF